MVSARLGRGQALVKGPMGSFILDVCYTWWKEVAFNSQEAKMVLRHLQYPSDAQPLHARSRAGMQEYRHTGTQARRRASTQARRYVGTQAGTQACKYAGRYACKPASRKASIKAREQATSLAVTQACKQA